MQPFLLHLEVVPAPDGALPRCHGREARRVARAGGGGDADAVAVPERKRETTGEADAVVAIFAGVGGADRKLRILSPDLAVKLHLAALQPCDGGPDGRCVREVERGVGVRRHLRFASDVPPGDFAGRRQHHLFAQRGLGRRAFMSQLERGATPFPRIRDELLVIGARQFADVRETSRHVEGAHVVRPVERLRQRGGERGDLARSHGLDGGFAGCVAFGGDERPAVRLCIRLRRALLERGDAAQRNREREGTAIDEWILRRAENAQEVCVERGILPPAGGGGLCGGRRERVALRVQRGAERDRAHADILNRKRNLPRCLVERGGLLRPVDGRRLIRDTSREQGGKREGKAAHFFVSSACARGFA